MVKAQEVRGSSQDHAPTTGSALEADFTPGPWKIVASRRKNNTRAGGNPYSPEWLIQGPYGRWVISRRGIATPASIWGAANARLIAAAPELADAAARLINSYDEYRRDRPYGARVATVAAVERLLFQPRDATKAERAVEDLRSILQRLKKGAA